MPTKSVQRAMLCRSVGGIISSEVFQSHASPMFQSRVFPGTTSEKFRSHVSPDSPGPQGKELAALQGVALQCRPGRDPVPISPRFARAQRGQELPQQRIHSVTFGFRGRDHVRRRNTETRTRSRSGSQRAPILVLPSIPSPWLAEHGDLSTGKDPGHFHEPRTRHHEYRSMGGKDRG